MFVKSLRENWDIPDTDKELDVHIGQRHVYAQLAQMCLSVNQSFAMNLLYYFSYNFGNLYLTNHCVRVFVTLCH